MHNSQSTKLLHNLAFSPIENKSENKKNIFTYKKLEIEMIPEEDEERIKTENETGKKFYEENNSEKIKKDSHKKQESLNKKLKENQIKNINKIKDLKVFNDLKIKQTPQYLNNQKDNINSRVDILNICNNSNFNDLINKKNKQILYDSNSQIINKINFNDLNPENLKNSMKNIYNYNYNINIEDKNLENISETEINNCFTIDEIKTSKLFLKNYKTIESNNTNISIPKQITKISNNLNSKNNCANNIIQTINFQKKSNFSFNENNNLKKNNIILNENEIYIKNSIKLEKSSKLLENFECLPQEKNFHNSFDQISEISFTNLTNSANFIIQPDEESFNKSIYFPNTPNKHEEMQENKEIKNIIDFFNHKKTNSNNTSKASYKNTSLNLYNKNINSKNLDSVETDVSILDNFQNVKYFQNIVSSKEKKENLEKKIIKNSIDNFVINCENEKINSSFYKSKTRFKAQLNPTLGFESENSTNSRSNKKNQNFILNESNINTNNLEIINKKIKKNYEIESNFESFRNLINTASSDVKIRSNSISNAMNSLKDLKLPIINSNKTNSLVNLTNSINLSNYSVKNQTNDNINYSISVNNRNSKSVNNKNNILNNFKEVNENLFHNIKSDKIINKELNLNSISNDLPITINKLTLVPNNLNDLFSIEKILLQDKEIHINDGIICSNLIKKKNVSKDNKNIFKKSKNNFMNTNNYLKTNRDNVKENKPIKLFNKV